MSPLCQVGQPCHYIPFPKNKRFVGRENIVDTLKEMFFTNECQNVAVIGLGGVGKTQVALKFAYWVKETGSAMIGVFLVDHSDQKGQCLIFTIFAIFLRPYLIILTPLSELY